MVMMAMGGPMGGPMGALGGGLHTEVPAVIKQKHAKYWWMLFVLQLATVVVELVASDVFGVLFSGAIAFCIWYMVRGSCRNMTQYCLFMFGLMCLIEALFEIITLGTVIGGRSSATTTLSVSEDVTHTVSYTTVVDTTPFFDWGQGLTYNAESLAYLLSPATMVIGAIISYCSYCAYPVGMWGDTDLEDGGNGDLDGSFDRRFRDEQLRAAGSSRGAGPGGAHGERERRPPVFAGYARRLGD
mmetsp:Transcript_78043/g.211055  ORF Transcript_78043/g.211055 Transcript_78043/m.211055 type:complete len:242 (-) Transcript_78043:45-770(-)